ncbi:MAG TPA: tRNA (guanine(10)-N(2))-dimethyltransferase [Armatimonadetes bacterium]|nr:tRNA (guanine(10)-N(2))-dimethyltransferase [Armatimonadota bacterium]
MLYEGKVALNIEVEEIPTRNSRVFYNPHMRLSRDLSVGVVAVYAKRVNQPLTICDALSGCGVRGLRYGLEVPQVNRVVLNDVNPHAYEKLCEHIELNKCSTERYSAYCEDANVLLHRMRNQFDVIDIDPFGSFLPFLDAALDGIRWGGLLCLVATDTAVPCGVYPRTCRRHYGVTSLQTSYRHELALRIYVSTVIQRSAQLDYAFRPVMSLFQQHYVRLFGIVIPKAYEADKLLDEFGFVYHCFRCEFRTLSKRPLHECPYCLRVMRRVGPVWLGALTDGEFARDVVDELKRRDYQDAARLAGLLADESKILTPFYDIHALASIWDVSPPSMVRLLMELEDRGYRATRTHFSGIGIKTDAPLDELRKAMMKVAQ